MRNFYVTYQDDKKLMIMEKCKEILEREFYIQMTKRYGWTKDVLINHIENHSYEIIF